MLGKKGLTMIEMLTVIAIISILFILLIPQINSAIEKTKEAAIVTDFNDYRSAGMLAVLDGSELSEESLNRKLGGKLVFENGKSKKETPFRENYYLYVTTEGYTIVTERKDKMYTLTINTEGETTNSFESGELILGGDVISKPNDSEISLETDPNDFEYIDLANNEISIYAYKGNNTNLVIPSEIDGKKVVKIQPDAFANPVNNLSFGRGKIKLRSVVIPEGVKEIGYDAFTNNDLVSVTVPSTVETIGFSTFNRNPIVKIYIHKDNQHYKTDENNAGVYSKDGKKIFIGTNGVFGTNTYKNIEEIALYSFWGNDIGLVFIPKSVTEIHDLAFMDNSRLKFEVEDGNPYFAHGENNEGLYSKDFTKIYAGSKGVFGTSTYRNVQAIAGISFYGAELNYAFIPKSVNRIDAPAFKNNPNIKFEVEDGHTEFTEGENGIGLYSKDKKVLLVGTPSVFGTNDFNNVEEINNGAFYEMGLEGEITIPNSVKKIDHEGLSLNDIRKLILPSSLVEVHQHAFTGNYNLEEVHNYSNLDLRNHFEEWVEIKNK